jgi:hypothetical protein
MDLKNEPAKPSFMAILLMTGTGFDFGNFNKPDLPKKNHPFKKYIFSILQSFVLFL